MNVETIIPINYIERKPDSRKYRIVGKGVTVEFLSTFIGDPDGPVERLCENYGLTQGRFSPLGRSITTTSKR